MASHSDDCSSIRFLRLRPIIWSLDIGRCRGPHPGHSWHPDVYSCNFPIHLGVASNVQSDKAIPTQSLYEPSCEGKHALFSCVRLQAFLVHHLS